MPGLLTSCAARGRTCGSSAARSATSCSESAAHDLDVVVEGDAIAVARDARRDVVAEHDRFGTAEVRAGAVRRERQRRRARAPRPTHGPGALPDVTLGAAVAEDLRRRDFTVNAIARRRWTSAARGGGRIGAREDLAARRLRVPARRARSRDDPTRIRGAWSATRGRLRLTARAAHRTLARAAVADARCRRVSARPHRRRAAPRPATSPTPWRDAGSDARLDGRGDPARRRRARPPGARPAARRAAGPHRRRVRRAGRPARRPAQHPVVR